MIDKLRSMTEETSKALFDLWAACDYLQGKINPSLAQPMNSALDRLYKLSNGEPPESSMDWRIWLASDTIESSVLFLRGIGGVRSIEDAAELFVKYYSNSPVQEHTLLLKVEQISEDGTHSDFNVSVRVELEPNCTAIDVEAVP